MKVTKYEHATLLIERADDLLVIDPGSFLTPPDFHGTVAVVITHEHADHWTPEQLRRVLELSRLHQVLMNHGPKGVEGVTVATKMRNTCIFGSGRGGSRGC